MTRRCCCGACLEFEDHFYREDSTNLGADWDEVDGDWEIKSNHLYQSGTPGSFVQTTKHVPPRSAGEMYLAITASYFGSGQECELYAAYDEDSDTYWKATYKKLNSTGGGDWEVKLYKNTTLLDTVEMTPLPGFIDLGVDFSTDTNHTRCWICVDADGDAKAGVLSGDEPAWSIENGGLTGTGAAVGHPNSVATNLDDFLMAELHDATHECEACWCHCCGNLLSPRLDATITDAIGRAACIDGQSVDLLWDWDGGVQSRKGTITYNSEDFALSLGCASNGEDPNCSGQNISLKITSNCARIGGSGGMTCDAGDCILTPNPESTCSPLNLVFGPIYMDRGLLACTACYAFGDGPDSGTYYITITESAADEALFADGGVELWEDGTIRHWG